MYQVMSQCGSPDRREVKIEEKVHGKKKKKTKRVVMTPGQRSETVSSGEETWHYDCGPDGFVYVLSFSKSRLSSINAGGRGTRKGLPCPMASEWTRRKEMAQKQ
jgi:hypothetical protein